MPGLGLLLILWLWITLRAMLFIGSFAAEIAAEADSEDIWAILFSGYLWFLYFCVLVAAAGWVFFGRLLINFCLLTLFGTETIVMDGISLTTRRAALGIGRSKSFNVSEVRNLRARQSGLARGFRDEAGNRFPGSWIVVFDHAGKTHRMANDLDEEEAQILVAAIANRFPALAQANLPGED